MPDTDIPSAARRSAYRLKEGAWPHLDDLLALLPVLDAVAAGQDDEARVERMACAIRDADRGSANVNKAHRRNHWRLYESEARAAIALADAERAAIHLTPAPP